MQQIEAVVNQLQMQEVRNALEALGIDDFMESAIMCHQKGQAMVFRGATIMANIVEKVKLEIIAADDAVAGIIAAIGTITRAGQREECRIAVRPYQEVS
jgi:nitrogen regulatory protein PII